MHPARCGISRCNSPGTAKCNGLIWADSFAFIISRNISYEVEIDSEAAAREDTMGLPWHLVRSGVEREIRWGSVSGKSTANGVWR